jgi:hypothetical protein
MMMMMMMMMSPRRRHHGQKQRLISLLILMLLSVVPGRCMSSSNQAAAAAATAGTSTNSMQFNIRTKLSTKHRPRRYYRSRFCHSLTATNNPKDDDNNDLLPNTQFLVAGIPRGGGMNHALAALDAMDRGRVLTGLLGVSIYMGYTLYAWQFPTTITARNVDGREAEIHDANGDDAIKVTMAVTRGSAIYSSVMLLAYGVFGWSPEKLLRVDGGVNTGRTVPELVLHYAFWMIVAIREKSMKCNVYVQLLKACSLCYLIAYFTVRTYFYDCDCNPRHFFRWGSFLLAMLGYTKFSSPKLVREPSATTEATKSSRRGQFIKKQQKRTRKNQGRDGKCNFFLIIILYVLCCERTNFVLYRTKSFLISSWWRVHHTLPISLFFFFLFFGNCKIRPRFDTGYCRLY